VAEEDEAIGQPLAVHLQDSSPEYLHQPVFSPPCTEGKMSFLFKSSRLLPVAQDAPCDREDILEENGLLSATSTVT